MCKWRKHASSDPIANFIRLPISTSPYGLNMMVLLGRLPKTIHVRSFVCFFFFIHLQIFFLQRSKRLPSFFFRVCLKWKLSLISFWMTLGFYMIEVSAINNNILWKHVRRVNIMEVRGYVMGGEMKSQDEIFAFKNGSHNPNRVQTTYIHLCLLCNLIVYWTQNVWWNILYSSYLCGRSKLKTVQSAVFVPDSNQWMSQGIK